MKREELGKILEDHVGLLVRDVLVNGRDAPYTDQDVDDIYQWAAECFRDYVIETLVEQVKSDNFGGVIDAPWLDDWLEKQKIGEINGSES